MSHTASSTAVSVAGTAVPKILVVGGGYAGFYTAWKLEKHLRKGEAEVTIVDPLPYMTYQPFLPEVAAGEIEARHAVVGLRRHLKKTRVITAKVTGIDHANRTATITPEQAEKADEAIREALGDAYDCMRVWSAWSVGTMRPDDFWPVADSDERVAEIRNAVLQALGLKAEG